MARRKGAPTGRCQGCNQPERVRIERFLAAGASIKGAARKFDIEYHALCRHWTNHVSAEVRARFLVWRPSLIKPDVDYRTLELDYFLFSEESHGGTDNRIPERAQFW